MPLIPLNLSREITDGAPAENQRTRLFIMAAIKINMGEIKNESVIDNQSVTNCWLKIKSAQRESLFVEHFYQVLFEQRPDMRMLFPDDLKEQKTALLSMLNNVVNGIEFIDDLKKELLDLGERHKNIGIKKEMYDVFVTSMVIAANFASDFTLTDKELIAWENAFHKVTSIMLKAY